MALHGREAGALVVLALCGAQIGGLDFHRRHKDLVLSLVVHEGPEAVLDQFG